jgi:hypothetical protein
MFLRRFRPTKTELRRRNAQLVGELTQLREENSALRIGNAKLREEIRGWEIFANGSLRRERDARNFIGEVYPLLRSEELT